MKKNSNIIKPRVVFKRWSRKSYAVFVSLKKEISIGKVAKSIVEKSLTKGKLLQKKILRLFVQKSNLFIEKEEDIDILIEKILGIDRDNYVYLLPNQQKIENKNLKTYYNYYQSGCGSLALQPDFILKIK